MVRTISVRPNPSGWGVQIDGAGVLAFASGARAEAAARKLAAKYAAFGEHAEIRIYLKDGSLAARLLTGPRAETARPDAA